MGRRRSGGFSRAPEKETARVSASRGGAGTSSARPAGAARLAAIAIVLILANLAVYWQTGGFDSLDFDDDIGLYKNPSVSAGLTPAGIAWAFTTFHLGNWIPLTWISHMLDFSLFGANPGWHHLVNVLIHVANALLLFLLLARMTRAVLPAAAVAFLFSLHPLRVESVAWIIERKDVLSAFFWILTLWLYVLYVERPSARGRYRACIAAFALGLLVKPMLVTLPFVLLLLDWWPLGRWQLRGARADDLQQLRLLEEGRNSMIPRSRSGSPYEWPAAPAAEDRPARARSGSTEKSRMAERGSAGPAREPRMALRPLGIAALIREKIPLFVLAAAASALAAFAQKQGGAVRSLEQIPFAARLANAAVAYVGYIVTTLWPARLAVFYPYELHLPVWQVVGAVLLLAAVTALVLRSALRRPYAAVGWFWYLGALVPVIGLLQVGTQSMADRYTYLPSIGLLIAAVWLPFDLVSAQARGAGSGAGRLVSAASTVRELAALRRPHKRLVWMLGGAVALASVALGAASWNQARYWHDSITLFERALAVTEDNALAHYNLATAYAQAGRIDDAIAQYRETLRIRPYFEDANENLGLALFKQGQTEEAIVHYRAELKRDPHHPEAHCNLGVALGVMGRMSAALAEFQEAVRIRPGYAGAYYDMGLALEKMGRPEDAIAAYARSLAIEPDNADAMYNVAMALAGRERFSEALAHLARLVQVQPAYPHAAEDLRTLQRRARAGSPGP